MDQVSISNLVMKLDKCNGYFFLYGEVDEKNQDLREYLHQQQVILKNSNQLSEFQVQNESNQDRRLLEEMKLYKMHHEGLIDEDELYDRINKIDF